RLPNRRWHGLRQRSGTSPTLLQGQAYPPRTPRPHPRAGIEGGELRWSSDRSEPVGRTRRPAGEGTLTCSSLSPGQTAREQWRSARGAPFVPTVSTPHWHGERRTESGEGSVSPAVSGCSRPCSRTHHERPRIHHPGGDHPSTVRLL